MDECKPLSAGSLGGLPADHFDIPAGYVLKTLDEALQEAEAEAGGALHSRPLRHATSFTALLTLVS